MRTKVTMPSLQTAIPNRNFGERKPLKRATNLSLSADVLEAAKALELNVSQICDAHLRELVLREQNIRWKSEHADFIAAYNATIEKEGLPLEAWRTF